MKQLDYGKNYKYAHNYEGNFVKQQFLPEEVKNTKFFEPQQNPAEEKIKQKLRQDWGEEYDY
jgi:putative ATPase